MARRTIVVALVVLAGALFAPLPSSADHNAVSSFVGVFQGAKAVATYSATHGCSGTVCSAVVHVGKRDHNRVKRWCGATTFSVVIEPGIAPNVGVSGPDCLGGGSWFINIFASRSNTHAENVNVDVIVLP